MLYAPVIYPNAPVGYENGLNQIYHELTMTTICSVVREKAVLIAFVSDFETVFSVEGGLMKREYDN